MCYSVIPILLYTGILHIEWRVILKMSVCFSPGLVRRQWRVSGFPPSSSPPTLNWSRSLWTRSDSQTTGHWLNSRKTRRGGSCQSRETMSSAGQSPWADDLTVFSLSNSLLQRRPEGGDSSSRSNHDHRGVLFREPQSPLLHPQGHMHLPWNSV